VSAVEGETNVPGTRARGVYASAGRLLLACNPGTLELLLVQPSGRRPMEAAAFLRGHGLPGGR
jgi:methionyl-tRNA formyltransferase